MSIDIIDKAHREATANMATKWAGEAGRLRMKIVDAQVGLAVLLDHLAKFGDTKATHLANDIMEKLEC